MNKNSDGVKFAGLMTAISEMYSKPITDFGMDMWFDDLKDYDIDQVTRAFQAHRKDPVSGKYMPKTADIIRHIDGLPTEIATQAWLKVIHAIKCGGAWASVKFDDTAIHATIETMGGWTLLCGMTNDELPFKQREFEKIYTEKVKFPIGYVSKHLAGYAEIQNHSQGLPVQPPLLIGNHQDVNKMLTSRKAITHVN